MYGSVKSELAATLAEIRSAGLFKGERLLTTPQAAHIRTAGGDAVNFCANNYLGLADHPEVITAARSAGWSGSSRKAGRWPETSGWCWR